MSTTVDERVVEMKFDNADFEKNVSTSMSTLDKLKQSLDFTGATKGFESISSAASNVDMTGLSSGVETVHSKFSALEVVAVTALSNITNSAVNAGKKIVSALSIDSVKSGFEEYETQINAVQTILANTESKGTTLDQVNEALDELNTYADKTIYNFTEMTRNIGTFTAAGVDLDTSVSAIQGIANLAAVSGSTSTQASTAMYQLSQALATGTVKLQDWNSVVNAGMGGEVFQTALKRTAENMGTDVDALIEKYGSFRDSLTQGGWLTTEVLTETLTQLSGAYTEADLLAQGYSEEQTKEILDLAETAVDAATKVKTFTQLIDTLSEAAQSGWTQSWEIIVGDFGEAKELLTSVSDVLSEMINNSATSRNELLQGWKDLGGRTAIIDAISNTFNGLVDVATTIGEAFREIFPATTSQQLYDLSESIKNVTEKFKMGDETAQNLKNTFKGIFAVLDIGVRVFKTLASGAVSLVGAVLPAGTGFLSITGKIGEYLVKLDEWFASASESLSTFVSKVKEKVDISQYSTLSSVLERVQERLSQLKEVAGNVKEALSTAFSGLSEAFANSSLLSSLNALWGGLQKLGGGILTTLGSLLVNLFEKLGNIDFSNILDFVNAISLGGIGVAIAKFLKGASEPFESLKGIIDWLKGEGGEGAFSSFTSNITGVLDSVKGSLESFQKDLKAGTLQKIAVAIAILAGSLLVLSLIDSDKLTVALAGISALFVELVAAMTAFDKIGYSKGLGKLAGVMIAVSAAVLILSFALKSLASLDWDGLSKGIVGIGALTLMLIVVAKALSSESGTIMKGAASLVIFAAAIKVLASACIDFSDLSWDGLIKGLTGVGVLLIEVAAFLKLLEKSGSVSVGTATGILIISAAIKVFASACADFGDMSVKELVKGLGAIGVLLVELGAFTKLVSGSKGMVSMGTALVIIAASMKIFASAVSDFGGMSVKELAKGLAAMGVALLEVAAATRLMPNNLTSIGIGLVVVSAALKIVASALGTMGGMSWGEVAKGLVAMGGALAELSIALNLMNGTLVGSAALLVAAGALAILAPVLVSLSNLTWGGIAKGLIALAGAFTIIGIAGAVLSPLLPAILGLAGTLALIGVAALAVGAGVTLLAAGIAALAVAFASGAASIVAGATIIVTGLLGLVPTIIAIIGEAIVSICQVIANSASAIGEAVKAIVLTLVDVVTECAPAIAEGVLSLVSSVLNSLSEYAPQIVDSLLKFLINIINTLADNVPELIQAVMNLIGSVISGVLNALSGIDSTSLLETVLAVGLFSGIIMALSVLGPLIPAAAVGVVGMGAIATELAVVLAALGGLAQIPGLTWIIGEGGGLLSALGSAIGGFLGSIAGGFISGVSSGFPEVATNLSSFMTNLQPFIEGASSLDSSAMEGVLALAEAIGILTAADLISSISSWITGGSSIVDFGKQLAMFGPYLSLFAASTAGVDGEAVSNAANAAKVLAEMASNLPAQGGFVDWFTGSTMTLSDFAKELVPFGISLALYGAAISNLDADVVTKSATAASALAEMASNLPEQGGFVDWFTGGTMSLSDFAKELVPFGYSLSRYGKSIDGINSDIITKSASAATALSDFASNLPDQNGISDWFSGGTITLSDFADELYSFGPKLMSYAESVTGLDTEAITNSVTAATALVGLASQLPDQNGVADWFSGGAMTLADLGSALSDFAPSLAQYADDVSGLDASAISTSMYAAETLISMVKQLPDAKDSLSGYLLTNLGGQLLSFGPNFKSFYDNIVYINTEKITQAVDSLNSLLTFFKATKGLDTSGVSAFSNSLTQLGSVSAEGLTAGFSDSSIAATVQVTLDTALSGIDSKQSSFQAAGSNLMAKLVTGMNLKATTVKSAASSIVTGTYVTMQTYRNKFYTTGAYLVSGFASGITQNTYKAKAAAAAMASAANKAAQAALNEHSPSKEGYKTGAYYGEGFTNGIVSFIDTAYSTGTNLANSAKDGLNNAISTIASMVADSLDAEPTIAPVLDLSNVEAGMQTVNGMFANQTLSVNPTPALQVSSMMSRIQNGSGSANADVVSAIRKLGSDLSGRTGDTYNVNGVTYDDGSNITDAIKTVVRVARIERRT